ncbi:CPBP family intramembrane glutamic endopeptidase [Acidipila sp. EB88]|uniref:CPBP family intramembrane glutamic endopeptidase n=1 Tax=Acidipila sp. EB88 TaxID=2305226 RepID=UPI000F5FD733|nr:type II CAAX endopeptidase family protein [Acidipila sp. EB88]RRA47393.1 CPBP family intramembrane metalloprotease [Acidipila sp. EB88]
MQDGPPQTPHDLTRGDVAAPGTAREPQHPLATRSHILFGAQGLRAGWACLLFLAILAALGFALRVASQWLFAAHSGSHPAQHPAAITPGVMMLSELLLAAAVLLATLVMARIEGRPLLSFGLRGLNTARAVGGLLAGFAAISALVGWLRAQHLLVLAGPVLHGSPAWSYALLWAAAFLLVAVAEETMLRGYLLFTLARGIGFPAAAIVMSIAFGAIHGVNPGETAVGLFAAMAVGLLFCLSIFYTQSLWWAIAFHAAWDWGESFFWGTADSGTGVAGHLFTSQPTGPTLWSGGATGPEGSVLVFPVLVLVALLLLLWQRRRGRAFRPGSVVVS